MKNERNAPPTHGDKSGQSPTRKQEDGPGMERTLDRSQNMDRDLDKDPNQGLNKDPDQIPNRDPDEDTERIPGEDPKTKYPVPPFEKQEQSPPGVEKKLDPRADHGENSYQGNSLLSGKKAIITGGDSGIGKAIAIAFAREGADVLISYLNEEEDAKDTQMWAEKVGADVLLMPGDSGMSIIVKEW